MKSGSRRVEARTYPLSSEIARTSLLGPRLLFRHFSPRLDDFCRNANATLPPSPQRFYPPIFEKTILNERLDLDIASIRGYLSSVFVKLRGHLLRRESFSPSSRFLYIFQKLLLSKKGRSLVGFGWYSGTTEMAREGGEGKKEDTRESGSEPSVSRAQLVTPRFRHLLSLAKIVPAILKRGTPILPLIPLPQFHARPKKFPPTSIQKDENTLSVSLSTPLFSPL